MIADFLSHFACRVLGKEPIHSSFPLPLARNLVLVYANIDPFSTDNHHFYGNNLKLRPIFVFKLFLICKDKCCQVPFLSLFYENSSDPAGQFPFPLIFSAFMVK
jgi:hypothetical protein